VAGVADAASKVTCTIFGMELNSTTAAETYKTLYQGQLANSAATIYTATADGPTFVRSICVVNTDTVNRTFQLFSGGTAAANAVTPAFTLLPGGMAQYEDSGAAWTFYNASGQALQSLYAAISPLDNWGIAGCKGETMDRVYCPETNTTWTTTGKLWLQAVWLAAGTVVSNISFFAATTALGTGTHQFFGLYDSSRNLLATSADATSAAWSANTIKTLAMTSAYTIPTTGLYYLGVSVTATTMPTLKGGPAKTGAQLAATAPILGGATADAGPLTALPNPAGAITASTASVWGCVT
jgi:hypothetical protein